MTRTAGFYRHASSLEDAMMRAAMPRINRLDPMPRQANERPRSAKARTFTSTGPMMSFTIADVAKAVTR